MKFPQLHLRDLFWLVLVVAMGCAWWRERILSMQLPEFRRKVSQGQRELSQAYDALARAEKELPLTIDERLELAKDNEVEWRDRFNGILDAIEAKGYEAYWEHHSRTVELNRH